MGRKAASKAFPPSVEPCERRSLHRHHADLLLLSCTHATTSDLQGKYHVLMVFIHNQLPLHKSGGPLKCDTSVSEISFGVHLGLNPSLLADTPSK
mmetsp:Transcript_17588/g.38020  ORF Transcript_17588/g.38020 Transcript_17588/m.38020 type:complete len:95 (+) Transcript_17588:660-944(+)